MRSKIIEPLNALSKITAPVRSSLLEIAVKKKGNRRITKTREIKRQRQTGWEDRQIG